MLNKLNKESDSMPVQRSNILHFLVQKSFTDYQQVQRNLFQILDEMQEELSKKLQSLHQTLNNLTNSNFQLMQGIARCKGANINERVAVITSKIRFI